MRTLWNGLSFLAVVNLLALLILAGWLWQSGRLDVDRARAVRDVLAPTIAEEEAAAVKQEMAVLEAAGEAAAADRAQNPPLPGAVHAALRTQLRGVEHEVSRRLDEERRRLAAELDAREAALSLREDAVAARERALDTTQGEQIAIDAQAQFQKVVEQYELAAPKVAKEWVLTLVANGETDTIVRYLDAMDARAARKILNEFKREDEARLAADLLERVAVLGQTGSSREDASNADDTSGAP